MFKKAGHAEVIRSHQKDDYYINYLKSHISDISQALFGIQYIGCYGFLAHILSF